MKTKAIVQLIVAVLLATFNSPLSTVFGQGALTPPGAPAPTMKSLDQIEPRNNLQNAPISAVSTADPNYHFIILQPGSYYLSSNIVATKSHVIKIAATNVTLDLRGFQISGTNNLEGIEVVGQPRATIRNGSIHGFGYGIGIDGNSHAYQIRDMVVSGCTFRSMIAAGVGGTFESCRVHNNSGESGITAGPSAIVTRCTAYSNSFTFAAIYAQDGSTITECTANLNLGVLGFIAGAGCTVRHCTAHSNGSGIQVGTGSSVIECNTRANTTDGFQIGDHCHVVGNSADENATGFRVTGGQNRIDSNTAGGCGACTGFLVSGSHNLIIRNAARSGAGGGGFSIGANNAYGTVFSVNNGVEITNSNPWANFYY